jgi:hypothetical protein
MTDSSIPGVSSTKVGIGALQRYDGYEDDDDDRKKGGRKKFRGMYIDDDPMSRAEMDGSLNDDVDGFDMEGVDFEVRPALLYAILLHVAMGRLRFWGLTYGRRLQYILFLPSSVASMEGKINFWSEHSRGRFLFAFVRTGH